MVCRRMLAAVTVGSVGTCDLSVVVLGSVSRKAGGRKKFIAGTNQPAGVWDLTPEGRFACALGGVEVC